MLTLIFTKSLMLIIFNVAVPALLFVNTALEEVVMLQHASITPTTALPVALDWYYDNCTTDNPNTRSNKKSLFRVMFGFFAGQLRKPDEQIALKEITRARLQSFVTHRMTLDAPGTVNVRIATLKHFFTCAAEEAGLRNPSQQIKFIADKRIAYKAVPAELTDRATEAAFGFGNNEFTRSRNGNIVQLMFGTGLRAEDLRKLTIRQLSADLTLITDVEVKGRKFRNVYVPEHCRKDLAAYLHYREHALINSECGYRELSPEKRAALPLVVTVLRANTASPSTFSLTANSICQIVQMASARAGFKFSVRMLRHTFARSLLDADLHILEICQAMGHSDVKTTMRYTERTDAELGRRLETAFGKGEAS